MHLGDPIDTDVVRLAAGADRRANDFRALREITLIEPRAVLLDLIRACGFTIAARPGRRSAERELKLRKVVQVDVTIRRRGRKIKTCRQARRIGYSNAGHSPQKDDQIEQPRAGASTRGFTEESTKSFDVYNRRKRVYGRGDLCNPTTGVTHMDDSVARVPQQRLDSASSPW